MIPDPKDVSNTDAADDDEKADAMEEAQVKAADERKEGGYQ